MKVAPIVSKNAEIGDRFTVEGRHFALLPDGRIECRLCPRLCRLNEGQRGLCFVRARQNGRMVLTTYGRSSGFAVDPVEKKPLAHFLPGTPILSFGTAGCNLACSFCQNHEISKSREMDTLAEEASPAAIARAAKALGCRSVAFTYNDPVIFLEYAVDVAAACRAEGIRTVAVTAGAITKEARGEFFAAMDAANVDLKAFSEDFYRRLTKSRLSDVLETLTYLIHETRVWTELTTLLIPGENDSDAEIAAMCRWIAHNLNRNVPLHFSAFHPDHRMKDHARTPHATLSRARSIAIAAGLHHVYVGNVHDRNRQSSYCTGCGTRVIERDWHAISRYRLDARGHCTTCGTAMAGVFDGPAGTWGRKRHAVDMRRFRADVAE
ncbi:MAG: AmmeMemoRadiSam system radical SAM enzyme [Proteobacteria bacterium]|nr:AmmeMemoRadiSam system radical SAM enzyme [Pseudomonadota bacterium]MCA0424908.1 AmmeMemoRadiSam system radical SAM enzyme [Pseudomonadota bacterium]